MIFAIKLTKENFDGVDKWNNGVTPDEEDCLDSYLITWTSLDLANIIRSEKDFRADFEFVNGELVNEFSEVREL
jgi:hypothetical protein